MNTNYFKIFLILVLISFLTGCQTMQTKMPNDKPFKHNAPLIKDDIKKQGQAEIAKTLEMGPKPSDGKKIIGKRKQISSEAQRNYLLIKNLTDLPYKWNTTRFRSTINAALPKKK